MHTPEATVRLFGTSDQHRASSKYPGLIDPAIQGQAPKSRHCRHLSLLKCNNMWKTGKQNMCLLELFKCFSKSAGMSPSPCQVQRGNKKLCDALRKSQLRHGTFTVHTSQAVTTRYIQTNTTCGNPFVQNSKGKLHELANVLGSDHLCVGVRTWQGLPSVSRDRQEFPLLTSGYKSSSSSRCNKKAHLSQVMNMNSLHG